MLREKIFTRVVFNEPSWALKANKWLILVGLILNQLFLGLFSKPVFNLTIGKLHRNHGILQCWNFRKFDMKYTLIFQKNHA